MDTKKANIVLVEDNMADAELIMRAFVRNKISDPIIHLKDGEQALDFVFCRGIHANRNMNDLPKLILLDIKMPKVDGLEVLQQIKSSDKTKIIPVVLFTSSKEEKDILQSYQLGANSYIVKPADFDGYKKVVSDLSLYWLQINQHPNQL
jgi:CheY-like chemotaxis protein